VVGITDSVCAILELLATLLLWYAAARWRRGPLVRRPVLVALASLPLLLLGAFLTFGGVALASDGFTSFTRAGGPLPASVPAGKLTTVTYCTQDGTPLAMDIYEPPAGAARPAPVALYVHGGGWVLGSRKLSGGLGTKIANPRGALVPRLRPVLNQRGFVVASIDYRLGGSSRWPGQLEDAKCAVRFLRANAGRLGIDPDRFGAWGSSAGGDLVSLLGVVGPQAGYDRGQYADQSSRVQAVVDMFGAADLTDIHDTEPFMRTVIQLALGGSTSVRRSASPANYLDDGDHDGVRYLLLQGTADTAHPPRHAHAFASALKTARVPVQLVIVQGANHTLDDPAQQPSPDQVTGMVADFFTSSLASGSGR
jgi:acetyl esterase/lipase